MGRSSVLISHDDFMRLWDNVTSNYKQLQEWNIAEEFGKELTGKSKISICACNKYIVVSIGTPLFI